MTIVIIIVGVMGNVTKLVKILEHIIIVVFVMMDIVMSEMKEVISMKLFIIQIIINVRKNV